MTSSIIKLGVLIIVIAVAYKIFFQDRSRETMKNKRKYQQQSNDDEPQKTVFLYNKTVIKVTDHVYVAVGYAIANMMMIEGSDGIIIVDSTESGQACLEIYAEFRKITSKPLKAIVISHFHADHILGASYLLELEENKNNLENIKVIMNCRTAHELQQFKLSTGVGFKRTVRQFGVHLNKSGAKARSTPAPEPEAYSKIVKATITFEDEATFHIAGVSFTLIHTPGESNDLSAVWIPEWRVVFPGDNIYDYFPNISPIRGSSLRESQTWYKSLDKVRHLRAEHFVAGHMKPLSGEDHIFEVVTDYRDAIQFVFDQTIRWMNKGLDIDEIAEKVRLPPSLESHPFLQQHYGKVAWAVRSVFNGQLGWFGGDPAYLNPLSKRKRAIKLAELITADFSSSATGSERLLHHAKLMLQQSEQHFMKTGDIPVDDVQWALELASDAKQASDSTSNVNKEAKEVAANAMKLLAKKSANFPERNYYLTSAAELNEGLVIAVPEDRKRIAIESSKVEDIMSRFQYRFAAESCDSSEILTVIFEFSDVNQTFAYIMRNCIVEYIDVDTLIPKEFNTKLTMSSRTWKNVITGQKSSVVALATGDIAVQGNLLDFRKFMNLMDKG